MKRITLYLTCLLVIAATATFIPTTQAKGKKSGGSAQPQVVYTGEIAKKVIGYNGPTPLNITISGGKITNIEALDNNDTPKYFKKAADKIFPQYIGKTVDQALKFTPDIATGATYSSKAIIENMQLGLKQAKGGAKANGNKPAKGKKRMTRK